MSRRDKENIDWLLFRLQTRECPEVSLKSSEPLGHLMAVKKMERLYLEIRIDLQGVSYSKNKHIKRLKCLDCFSLHFQSGEQVGDKTGVPDAGVQII